jgi:hypothetical protein
MISLYKFSFLMNCDTLKSEFDGNEQEFFWSILDYSTISKCAPDIMTVDESEDGLDIPCLEEIVHMPYL